MSRIVTPDYIEFDLGEDYISFRKYPDLLIETYDTAEKIDNINDFTSFIEKIRNCKCEHVIVSNYDLDCIPRGYIVVMYTEDGEDYVAISSDSGATGELYRIPDWRDFFSDLITITVSGDCIEPIMITNTHYDYLEITLNDGTVVMSEDDEYYEIIRKLNKCKEIEIGDAY